jgi:hypothetical protein
MMNALAWDDEPNGYMADLAHYLLQFHVKLTICAKEADFIHELNKGDWDFVITDLIREDKGGNQSPLGAVIAQKAASQHTVFMITQHYQRIDPGKNEYGIPPQVIVKSKSTHPGWLAGEICEDLRKRGVYFHHKKVFLIYGHDRLADNATKNVTDYLTDSGLELQMVTPERLFGEIANGLMERMHDCAAFVTICTPDDKVDVDGKMLYQPRQNVLFEMGMAMGLNRGLEKLVILQRWGKHVEEQAYLPSDLGGVVPIRFEGRVEDKLDDLRKKLVELKVDLSDPPKNHKKRKR